MSGNPVEVRVRARDIRKRQGSSHDVVERVRMPRELALGSTEVPGGGEQCGKVRRGQRVLRELTSGERSIARCQLGERRLRKWRQQAGREFGFRSSAAHGGSDSQSRRKEEAMSAHERVIQPDSALARA